MPGKQGKALTQQERDAVLATYKMNGSIRGTARALNLNVSTVQYIIHPKKHSTGTGGGNLPELRSISEAKVRDKVWGQVGAIFLRIEATTLLLQHELDKEAPDHLMVNAWASALQRLHISYGIAVEKARLLHNESTGIIAKVEELERLPEGVTSSFMVELVRARVHGIQNLLPPGQAVTP